jgi:hypothetical protein
MAWFPDDRPPIAWSLWERVRAFTGIGVLLALGINAITLVLADIPAGVVPTKFHPEGAPLWPLVADQAVMFPLAGLAAALLLPLYRYKGGGRVVGSLVFMVLLTSSMLVDGIGEWNFSAVEGWQRAAALGLMMVFGGFCGAQASGFVLHGKDHNSGDDASVT